MSDLVERYALVSMYLNNQTDEEWDRLVAAIRRLHPPIVVISVQGGTVQGIRSDGPATCEVLDYDNMEGPGCEGDELAHYEQLETKFLGLSYPIL
jgi:hypothetical protein